jgi:predicted nucleic-acid-binding protein
MTGRIVPCGADQTGVVTWRAADWQRISETVMQAGKWKLPLQPKARRRSPRPVPAIEQTSQAAELVVQNEQEIFTAMIALRQGPGSFAGALIAALGRAAGCTHTVTFGRTALRLEGFAAM